MGIHRNMRFTTRLLTIASRRYISNQQTSSRHQLLLEIYHAAFQNLEKDSPEYNTLSRSGKVWENFFKPQDVHPYLLAQTKLQSTLDRVDKQKLFYTTYPKTFNAITRALVHEYAHQSTGLEGSNLQKVDSLIIEDELEKQFFNSFPDLACLTAEDLASLALPLPSSLLPEKPAVQVAELRNHIVVSRYLAEVGLTSPNTAGITISEIRHISRLMLQGTDAEDLYSYGWGKRLALGDFRFAPITVRSNPMRIFPYPPEVPALMERFIKWRDDCHTASQLHPLILATQIFVYFCHIHPFPDGNGRVGRALMADFMVRQGYLPVVFQNMDGADYLRMMSDTQDKKPEELCEAVAFTQLEMMYNTSLRD